MKKLLILLSVLVLQAQDRPGLENLSATCYMNASLQSLFSLAPFTHFMLTHDTNKLFPKDSIGAEYSTLFFEHLASMRNVMSPAGFFTCVARNSLLGSLMSAGRQEDAQEFVGAFIDRISDEALTKEYKKELHDLFYSSYVSKFTCPNCRFASNPKVEPFSILQVALEGCAQTLPNLMHGVFQTGFVDDYRCERCGKIGANKTIKPNSLAPVVIIQLVRFRYDEVGSKISDVVDIPLTLNMGQFLEQPTTIPYELVGVVAHAGTLVAGHYKAYVARGNSWYECNDSVVTKLDQAALARKLRDTEFMPYLLFYQVANFDPSRKHIAPAQPSAVAVPAIDVPPAKQTWAQYLVRVIDRLAEQYIQHMP